MQKPALRRWSLAAVAILTAWGISAVVIHQVSAAPPATRTGAADPFDVQIAQVKLKEAQVNLDYAQEIQGQTKQMVALGRVNPTDQWRADHDFQMAQLHVD